MGRSSVYVDGGDIGRENGDALRVEPSEGVTHSACNLWQEVAGGGRQAGMFTLLALCSRHAKCYAGHKSTALHLHNLRVRLGLGQQL